HARLRTGDAGVDRGAHAPGAGELHRTRVHRPHAPGHLRRPCGRGERDRGRGQRHRGGYRLTTRTETTMSTATTGSNAVDVRGTDKNFGRFRALDGLDLTVRTGQVAGFLGPNGS